MSYVLKSVPTELYTEDLSLENWLSPLNASIQLNTKDLRLDFTFNYNPASAVHVHMVR